MVTPRFHTHTRGHTTDLHIKYEFNKICAEWQRSLLTPLLSIHHVVSLLGLATRHSLSYQQEPLHKVKLKWSGYLCKHSD
jgi:hypothetical protein